MVQSTVPDPFFMIERLSLGKQTIPLTDACSWNTLKLLKPVPQLYLAWPNFLKIISR